MQSRNAGGTGRFGDMPREGLEKFQEYLVATGVLPGTIDVGRYATNDLIAEINDFDADAVSKNGARIPSSSDFQYESRRRKFGKPHHPAQGFTRSSASPW